MKKSEQMRERLINAATALLAESSGDTAEITTRAIAQRAGVGVGLVNYHFGTKEQLLTLCVQRIIEGVVTGFAPKEQAYTNGRERLTDWAARVFEFLYANPAISRVSILGDMADYGRECNSVKTQLGFGKALEDGTNRAFLCFVLTSAMQAAFLSGETGTVLLGFDFSEETGRRAFIEKLVGMLWEGLR